MQHGGLARALEAAGRLCLFEPVTPVSILRRQGEDRLAALPGFRESFVELGRYLDRS